MEQEEQVRRSSPVTGIAAALLALGILWIGTHAHLKRSCVVMDAPYLGLCGKQPEAAADKKALAVQVGSNPGDSMAWTQLLVAHGPDAANVLKSAAAVAPNNPNVLRWRAVEALEAGKLPEAVALLVQLLQDRGSPEAARILAQLLTSAEGVALLRPHVARSETWLPSVLATMPALKIPPGQALPLVVEAMERGALPDTARHAYMRSLKDSGQWLDAYGLWLAYQKQTVPLLYNGGFDQALEVDGFDWEFSVAPRSKAGVIFDQQAVARRGLVLLLEFTGRGFTTPIVRQHVFAPPGPYRLRGEYMGAKLRSDSGLRWSVVCTSAGKAVTARSAALQDTGGVWKPFEVEFTVPADCGPVATVQLEPVASFESTAGIKGTVAFDSFGLTRMAN